MTLMAPEQYARPDSSLYAPGMVVKLALMGIQGIRDKFAERVQLAAEEGEHTVVQKRGTPVAALVPMEWYREMRQLSGDPTEL
jgi:hypothetical protein